MASDVVHEVFVVLEIAFLIITVRGDAQADSAWREVVEFAPHEGRYDHSSAVCLDGLCPFLIMPVVHLELEFAIQSQQGFPTVEVGMCASGLSFRYIRNPEDASGFKSQFGFQLSQVDGSECAALVGVGGEVEGLQLVSMMRIHYRWF